MYIESPPDCKYLIRTENHFGKFDIFILYFISYFLRKLSTCFHFLFSFFLCCPRRTRASNTCVSSCFLHICEHSQTRVLCVCVCRCMGNASAYMRKTPTLLFISCWKFVLFVPTSTETLDVHFWLNATRIQALWNNTHTHTPTHTLTHSLSHTHTHTRSAVKRANDVVAL